MEFEEQEELDLVKAEATTYTEAGDAGVLIFEALCDSLGQQILDAHFVGVDEIVRPVLGAPCRYVIF